MTGKTVGCLTVVERAPSGSEGARWLCFCNSCGDRSTVDGWKLRKLKFNRCRHCPTRTQMRRYVTHVSLVNVKNRMYEPVRERQKMCRECCNLPWQRPRYGCVACGGEYAEEVIEPFERRRFSPAALCVEAG